MHVRPPTRRGVRQSVIAGMLGVLAMSACAATDVQEDATSPSAPTVAASTPEPTTPNRPSPTPTPPSRPQPSELVLAGDGIALSVVDSLRVREEPSLEAEQVSEIDHGTRMFIISGPESDGADPSLEWWLVAPYACEGGCGYDPRIGWVTSGPDRGWLAPAAPECPASFTPDNAVVWYSSPELLACLGSEPITLEGTIDYWCCSAFSFATTEPAWLAGECCSIEPKLRHSAEPNVGSWGPPLRVDPTRGIELGERGTVARITGHLDDHAAADCVANIEPDDLALNPNLEWTIAKTVVEYGCRLEFVVDSVEVLDFIPLPTHPPQG